MLFPADVRVCHSPDICDLVRRPVDSGPALTNAHVHGLNSAVCSLSSQSTEAAFGRAVKFINTNLASGKLKPIIARTFPLAKVQEAHRYMESDEQLGKIVMTV